MGRAARIKGGVCPTFAQADEEKKLQQERLHAIELEKAKSAAQTPSRTALGSSADPKSSVTTVKMSTVLNQSLEAEVPLVGAEVLKKAYACYHAVFEVEPTEDRECTHGQLNGLKKLLDFDIAPYVDFAVWRPHSLRVER